MNKGINRVARDNAVMELNALLLELDHYKTQALSPNPDLSHMGYMKAMCMGWYIEAFCEQWGIELPIEVEQ